MNDMNINEDPQDGLHFGAAPLAVAENFHLPEIEMELFSSSDEQEVDGDLSDSKPPNEWHVDVYGPADAPAEDEPVLPCALRFITYAFYALGLVVCARLLYLVFF